MIIKGRKWKTSQKSREILSTKNKSRSFLNIVRKILKIDDELIKKKHPKFINKMFLEN